VKDNSSLNKFKMVMRASTSTCTNFPLMVMDNFSFAMGIGTMESIANAFTSEVGVKYKAAMAADFFKNPLRASL
jgi:hypothetical protein